MERKKEQIQLKPAIDVTFSEVDPTIVNYHPCNLMVVPPFNHRVEDTKTSVNDPMFFGWLAG